MSSIPPNTSLYVKNIDGKIKKPELRQQLYAIFNSYGKVIDVVATKVAGMQGQAFVVFQDLASATAALRSLNGFEFYDRPLRIEYAQNKSKATIIHDLGHEALFDPKIAATMKKGGAQASEPGKGRVTYSSAEGKEKKRPREEDEDDAEEEDEDEEPSAKIQKTGDEKDGDEQEDDDEEEMEMEDDDEESGPQPEASSSGPSGPAKAEAGEVANEILYCPGLSDDVTDEMLGVLFSQHDGFQKVELNEEPPASKRSKKKTQYAFVTFENAEQAGKAKDALDQFKLAPRKLLKVFWAARG